ncbi:MAG TPA: tetratricopeptide repeat protein [Oculatellaceae cyanobacterium]
MARKSKHVAWILSALVCGTTPAVLAQDSTAITKLNDSAQQAFDSGKYRKAEVTWSKAVKAIQDNGEKDSFLESCLKRLGQTYKRLAKSVEAYRTLSQALEMCKSLSLADQELAKEMSELSTVYRAVDISQLGDGTMKALSKANVTSIGLFKTSMGTKMQVDLPEKFEKKLDNDSVDGLAFDKSVTLDLSEDSDGTVNLRNIKGLRIHAKEPNMWVNLLQAVIKPGDNDGAHPADVTAGKMGVTKTVSASLPAKGFEPVIGLVKQLHAMDTPIPPESILASVAPIGPTAPAAPATEPPAPAAPEDGITSGASPSGAVTPEPILVPAASTPASSGTGEYLQQSVLCQ